MKRNAIITTIEELRKIADDLEQEVKEHEKEHSISGWGTRFELPIINKSELSDEWEFEKDS